LFFALLLSYPWPVLTIGTVAYLACLPLSWLSYREYQRKDAAAAAANTAGTTVFTPGAADHAADENHSARLN
jgi:CDP-diacylglycerol---serine O-phosphatidyltransferase